ncbi:MAG: DUF4097 domain-containing protein [Phycisphaerae bacterium]
MHLERPIQRISKLLILALVLPAGCIISSYSTISGPSPGFRAEASREEDFPLDLRPDDALIVASSYGDIDIQADDTTKPHVLVSLRAYARTEEDAQALLDQYHLRTERTARGVRLVLDGTPRKYRTAFGVTRIRPQVHFEAVVPAKSKLDVSLRSGRIQASGPFGSSDLSTRYGSIDLTDVAGDVSVRTRSGSIALRRAHGDTVDVQTGHGAIRLAEIDAGYVRAETYSGRVTLEDIDSKRLMVTTSYGPLSMTRVSAQVTARTSSGSMTLTDVRRGPVDLRSGYGQIEVRKGAGELTAHTASGNVRVEDFDGRVDAETSYGSMALDGVFSSLTTVSHSGAIRVTAAEGSKPTSPWSLRSGNGGLELTVPADFDCRLQAQTGFGSIDVDVPMQLERTRTSGRNELSGVLGKGGPAVSLETASGSIRLGQLAKAKPGA